MHDVQAVLVEEVLRQHGGGQGRGSGEAHRQALEIGHFAHGAVLAHQDDAAEIEIVAHFAEHAIAVLQGLDGLVRVGQGEIEIAPDQLVVERGVVAGRFQAKRRAGNMGAEVVHDRPEQHVQPLRIVQGVNAENIFLERFRRAAAVLRMISRRCRCVLASDQHPYE